MWLISTQYLKCKYALVEKYSVFVKSIQFALYRLFTLSLGKIKVTCSNKAIMMWLICVVDHFLFLTCSHRSAVVHLREEKDDYLFGFFSSRSFLYFADCIPANDTWREKVEEEYNTWNGEACQGCSPQGCRKINRNQLSHTPTNSKLSRATSTLPKNEWNGTWLVHGQYGRCTGSSFRTNIKTLIVTWFSAGKAKLMWLPWLFQS